LPEFHRYAARVGYVMACGEPVIDAALYYPVRDIWATGDGNDPPVRMHDALAQGLLQRQCDFDVVDDDVLCDPATRLENGCLAVGPMRYRTLVMGPTWRITDAAEKQLKAFEAGGGRIVRVEDADHIAEALGQVAPTVRCDPPSGGIRVALRRWPGGGAAFLFNEGEKAYHGTVSVELAGKLCEIEPATGRIRAVEAKDAADRRQAVSVNLGAGESMLLVAGEQGIPTEAVSRVPNDSGEKMILSDGWTARTVRRYVAGEHDYEIQSDPKSEFKPVELGGWAKTLGLGEDFSGHVAYRRTVELPASWQGKRLVLDLGGLEYAARVSVDGKPVGCVLWSPWQIELPPRNDSQPMVIDVEVANTLANELTSSRVVEAWSKRSGPGWPSCYHKRALDMEKESRGGGLLGPVQLRAVAP
jgi:hypothetical protein